MSGNGHLLAGRFKSGILILLFLLTGGLSSTASGRIDRAFAALDVHDYFNARISFLKSFEKYPCVSGYGLSIITGRNDNPFFNTDSAYIYILNARVAFSTASSSEAKLMTRHGVSPESIERQIRNVEETAYRRAEAKADTASWNHFLSFYSSSKLVGTATHLRDSILFVSLKKRNDPVALKSFIDTYPSSHLYTEAKALYEKVLYRDMTAGGTLEEYESFLVMYPSSPYRREAEENLYRLFIGDEPTIGKYHEYVKKYPLSIFAGHAWNRIYDLYLSEYNESAFESFRRDYPDYPYQERLMEDIKLSSALMFPVVKNGLYGFINASGEITVDPRYESVSEFSEGLALVYRDGKAGFITKSGDEVVPPFYDEAEAYQNNVAVVTEGGISGVIDRNGKMLIPLSFDEISDFEDGIAAASRDGKFGFIDKSGRTIIPFKYDAAGGFSGGTAVCVMEGKYGIIDRSGNVVVPFIYEAVDNFKDGLARIMSGDKWGLINRESKIIVEPVYDEIGVFSNGRALVIRNRKSGYIDTNGRQVIPFIYDTPPDVLDQSKFRQGRAVVRYKGKYGVVDTSGKKLLPYRFQEVVPVDSALFAVKLAGKWGVTDRSGLKAVIPFRYEGILPAARGMYIAYLKQHAGLISSKGKTVMDFRYDYLKQVDDTVFISGTRGMFGVTGISGVPIIQESYNSIDVVHDRYLRLRRDSDYSWYDLMEARYFWNQ